MAQVAALIVAVLVGIPYMVLWYSLTADEEEDKFDQAHRWKKKQKNNFHAYHRFIGLGFLAIGAQNIFPFIKSYPLRLKHCQMHNAPKALSTLNHSTPLVQSRSFNKL